jgi:hypothetical protein
VLTGVMTGGPATLVPLAVSILVGVGLLMMLANTTDPITKPGLVNGTLVAMALAVAVMSITRHQVRVLYLAPSSGGFEWTIAPQWGNFTLFVILLVAGLATVAYMVRRVAVSPASGADAA